MDRNTTESTRIREFTESTVIHRLGHGIQATRFELKIANFAADDQAMRTIGEKSQK